MTPSTENSKVKPSLALAIATVLGVGYAPKAPGTFGSLVGVFTAMITALFFLRPSSVGDHFSQQRLMESTLMDHHFLVPGADMHNAQLIVPVTGAILLALLLTFIGVWSAEKVAAFAGLKDPQFVVIVEVAGQHITADSDSPAKPGRAHGFFRLRDFFRPQPDQLEISTGGIRAVPLVRYLEALSASQSGKVAGRMGHHGRRLAGGSLRCHSAEGRVTL
jgi:phosphatidylglycerophosphatase A